MLTSMIGNRGRRRPALLAVLSAATALALSGCLAGGTDSGSGGEQKSPRAARSTSGANADPLRTNYMTGYDARVDLLALNRLSEKVVAARFRVTNYDHEDLTLPVEFTDEGDGPSVSNTSLIAAKSKKQYFPFIAQDGKCVCSLLVQGAKRIGAGQSREYYAYFPAPPRNVQQVTVSFPLTPPFLSVPFGTTQKPAPVPSGQVSRRPSKLKLQPPKIVSLVSLTEATDNSKSTREDADSVKVRLSADVLFELNEATLTDKAQAVLEEVAKKIDRSRAKTIHVDGYTDSSGGPTINEPLSDDRADNVRKALEKLVDRDVKFVAEGHGADNPVASNDTPEGRQKNRRVTITVPKRGNE